MEFSSTTISTESEQKNTNIFQNCLAFFERLFAKLSGIGVILMMGEVPEDEVYDGFRIQVEALAKGGADAICVETMSDIVEACLAIRAAKEFTSLEVVSTFTFDKTVHGYYRSMMGVSPEKMVAAVKEAGADIIGANCGSGFDQMIEIVQTIRGVDKSTPVLIHANAGMPVIENAKTVGECRCKHYRWLLRNNA